MPRLGNTKALASDQPIGIHFIGQASSLSTRSERVEQIPRSSLLAESAARTRQVFDNTAKEAFAVHLGREESLYVLHNKSGWAERVQRY